MYIIYCIHPLYHYIQAAHIAIYIYLREKPNLNFSAAYVNRLLQTTEYYKVRHEISGKKTTSYYRTRYFQRIIEFF